MIASLAGLNLTIMIESKRKQHVSFSLQSFRSAGLQILVPFLSLCQAKSIY